jgi:hypothetical protein
MCQHHRVGSGLPIAGVDVASDSEGSAYGVGAGASKLAPPTKVTIVINDKTRLPDIAHVRKSPAIHCVPTRVQVATTAV